MAPILTRSPAPPLTPPSAPKTRGSARRLRAEGSRTNDLVASSSPEQKCVARFFRFPCLKMLDCRKQNLEFCNSHVCPGLQAVRWAAVCPNNKPRTPRSKSGAESEVHSLDYSDGYGPSFMTPAFGRAPSKVKVTGLLQVLVLLCSAAKFDAGTAQVRSNQWPCRHLQVVLFLSQSDMEKLGGPLVSSGAGNCKF